MENLTRLDQVFRIDVSSGFLEHAAKKRQPYNYGVAQARGTGKICPREQREPILMRQTQCLSTKAGLNFPVRLRCKVVEWVSDPF
jgi:hypothetical protein